MTATGTGDYTMRSLNAWANAMSTNAVTGATLEPMQTFAGLLATGGWLQ